MTKQPRIVVNTVKVNGKQLPTYTTDKLFCPIMFHRRDQNLTFTQLEQRGQLEITETKDFRQFHNVFCLLSQRDKRQSKFDDNQSVMIPNLPSDAHFVRWQPQLN